MTPLYECKPIGPNWVFKVNNNSQGEIARHKHQIGSVGLHAKGWGGFGGGACTGGQQWRPSKFSWPRQDKDIGRSLILTSNWPFSMENLNNMYT